MVVRVGMVMVVVSVFLYAVYRYRTCYLYGTYRGERGVESEGVVGHRPDRLL